MQENEKIKAGIDVLKSGDRNRATAIFADVVKSNPSSERGWYLLGICLTEADKREYCFRRVLTINPNNQEAAKQLAGLSKPAPIPPPAWAAQPAPVNSTNYPKSSPPESQPASPKTHAENPYQPMEKINPASSKIQEQTPPAKKPKKSPRLRVWLGLSSILLMTLIAWFAPLISPYDPRKITIGLSNYPPAWYHTPTKVGLPDHLLGTDLYGRDIFSHVIHGTRAAMFLALIAVPLTALSGVVVGIAAGSGNKVFEIIFLRLTDVVSAVPSLMFAVIIVFIFRGTPTGRVFGGLITLTLAFVLVNWVGLARLIYIAVLRIKQQEFMEASRSLGAGTLRQIFKHILPHLSHLIIVWVVNNIPAVILLEALFGYIGIEILQVADGSSFQDLSWGGLIFSGRRQLNQNPFMLLVPTLCILIISLSFAFLGEYLNERLNPQLESTKIV